MTDVRVGYVGLGAMGGALASRLVGGHRLTVWDINPQASARFEAAGAAVAPTAAELARHCEVVLLCLPRSSDVDRLLFGPSGMAEALAAGSIVIDQTSGVPEETREIARRLALRGIAMLDAPVAGGVAAAQEGRITMMVSGPQEVFERVAPVLRAIGPAVVRCGERLGDGQAIKMLNNTMNAACRVATLEAVALGRKHGLSLATIVEAINQGEGRSRISEVALTALLADKPSSDFALSLMIKDVDQAIQLSMKAGAPIPLSGVARCVFQIGANTLGPNARLEDVIGLVESMAATRFRDDAGAPTAVPGGPGASAKVAQLIESTLDACNRLIAYETIALGVKAGLKLDDMARVIDKGSGWTRAFERIMPVLASGAPSARLPLAAMAKDLALACRLGMEAGAPMLVAHAVRGTVEAAVNELGADANVDELSRLYEARAGIRFAEAATSK